MNDFGSRAQTTRFYVQIRVENDMSGSQSWAQGSTCYDDLKALDDKKNFRLWA